ncbi:ricin-type beta-trefoil lectin domain protein [Streptomyces gardneri]|uniref:ricin-type beta-trefoil lectin domain protein n=1 Tax=Streptomyces gardneri TaxID=66892 RepID=UPI0035E0187F
MPASAAEAAPPLAVESFAYPGAAEILAEHAVTLKAGDGNILLADCASEPNLVQVVRRDASPATVCFKVSGASGYLALEIAKVVRIKGDNHAMKATLNRAGTVSSVDIAKNDWTPVGEGDPQPAGDGTTLLELTAGGAPSEPVVTTDVPAVGRLTVGPAGREGSRRCTASLVDPLWALTSAGCFTDDPTSLAAGAPSVRSTFTAGGRTVEIAELVPRSDRDALMVRLATPVTGITPLKLAATAPTGGEYLRVAGLGRTATEWNPAKAHAGTYTVGSVTATGIDTAPGAGSAAICAGDAGAPLLREAGGTTRIAGIVSRAWQGGCLGTAADETRTDARSVRVDGLDEWIGAQTGRSFTIVNPAGERCLNLSGVGPWGNLTPVILFDCALGAPNEQFQITTDGQIRNPASGRCLNLEGASGWTNGTRVILFDCQDIVNEKFEWTADGQIRNAASGRCLNLEGAGGWTNGTRLILWECLGGVNEKFKLVPEDQAPNPIGRILNPQTGKCLNLEGGGPWDNGNRVILWDCTVGAQNELFQLTADGQIRNPASGRCLNLEGAGGWTNGTRVILWDCEEVVNEKFEWTADGQIRNDASGRCLNLEGAGGWANGTRVILWDCEDVVNEKFKLISVGG